MALKILNATNEPKLLPGEEASNAVDLPMVSAPMFPVRNVRDYFELQADLTKFLATHPREALLVADTALKSAISSPLAGSYYSMGAFKLGPSAVKYKTYPCHSGAWNLPPLTTNRNFLRAALIDTLMTKRQPACFILAAQWQKNAESMPVEDPSVEWRESSTLFSRAERLLTGVDPVSSFVPVAEIYIPPQKFTNPAISAEFHEIDRGDSTRLTPPLSGPEGRRTY